jgi:hypothetical protein
MHIIPYEEIDKAVFFDWLKDQSKEYSKPAHENMWNENWFNCPNTLPYMLECTDKFRNDNGKFYILLDDNTIVGCSGVYLSGFDFHVAIAGVRTWINKGYRNMALLKKYFFPVQRQWAIEQECKQIALTFNDYNKSLIRIFRMNKYPRTEIDLFYNGFNEVEFPTEIKNTKQWVVYENLDDRVGFDWNVIKWHR